LPIRALPLARCNLQHRDRSARPFAPRQSRRRGLTLNFNLRAGNRASPPSGKAWEAGGAAKQIYSSYKDSAWRCRSI